MTKVTLLTKKDLETETLKKLGVQCQGTDFASKSEYTSYWINTPSNFNYWGYAYEFYVVSASGLVSGDMDFGYGVHPVLIPDNFDEIIQNLIPREDGLSEVLYGEYPQKTADIQEELDVAYKSKKVNLTGKEYTVPYSAGHREYQLLEYEYQGKKYICKDNKWVEVTPIEWIVDEENKRLISKKVLLDDVKLNYDNETYNGHFKTTSLYGFLNNQFINEVMPGARQPEIEQTTDSLDKEIASLEAEIAQKKELIKEWKESKLELLTAVKASLDAEIASLGIETNSAEKGQHVMKPRANN